MRRISVSAFATLALCAFAAAPVMAADLGGPNQHFRMSVTGTRAGSVAIYDRHPGMVTRAYWRAPWRNRHYFPSTGEQPEQGRNEVIPGADREMPEPAERFFRMWSTSSVFAREEVPEAVLPDNNAPPVNPPPQQNPNAAPLPPQGGVKP